MAKFLKDLEVGPRGSSVTKLDRQDRDVLDGETAFEVRH